MNDWIRIIATLIALVQAGTASANEMRERSLDERIEMADVIIVGTYALAVDNINCDEASDFTAVRVEKFVKGSANQVLQLLVMDPIVEDRPICCNAGEYYLMFLKQIGDNRYASVNGRFGVYRLGAIQERQ